MVTLMLWPTRNSWPEEMTRIFIGLPGKMKNAGSVLYREATSYSNSRVNKSVSKNMEERGLFTKKEIIHYDSEIYDNKCVLLRNKFHESRDF